MNFKIYDHPAGEDSSSLVSSYSNLSQLVFRLLPFIFVLTIFFAFTSKTFAANRFSVSSNNWNSTSTWSATSGGASGATVPIAGDIVVIEGGFTVTLSAAAACATLTIGTATSGILRYSNNIDINFIVTGNITVAALGSFVVNAVGGNNEHTLLIGGNLIVNNIFNMVSSGNDATSTTFNGTSTQTISGTGGTCIFQSLIINNTTTSGVVLNRNINLEQEVGNSPYCDLTINANAVFDISSFTANKSYTIGTFTCSSGSKFRVGGTNTLPTNWTYVINATSTIEYYGSSQSITILNNAQVYGNLLLSGSGTKTFNSVTAITNNITINNTAVANLGTFTSSATTLTLGGLGQPAGSWGSTASPATFKNLQYFGSTATGILNVGTGSCTAGTWLGTTSTDWNLAGNWCGGIPTATTDVIIPSSPANQPVIGATGGLSRNLTINSGASLTVTGSYSLTVSGNWSNNGTFTPNSSTVTFNGTAQSIGGSTNTAFKNILLSNSGTKTLGIAITVDGNLSIAAGVVANLGTFTSSAGTLTLGGIGQPAGSWGSTASAATYKNSLYFGTTATGILNVSGSTCTTGTWLGLISTDWNVATNWCGGVPTSTTDVIIPSGPTNQPIIGNAGGLSRNLTINSGASLTITASNTLAISGNWSNSGTFTPNTSTVNFNGTAQSIGGSVSTTFNNLILSNGGTKTFGITTTITANISIALGVTANLGTFTSSAGTLTLGGIGQPSGSWGSTASTATNKNLQYFGSTALGILNVSGGTCTTGTWLGTTSTDWNVASNWCGGIPTATTDIIVPAGPTNQPVIGAAGGLSRNLTINSGASLTISGSNTLSISGNWSNNGTFTANTSTVTFNGTTQSIGGSVTTLFNNLVLSNSGTKTFATSITINANLSVATGVIINLGTFTSFANSLTLGGIGEPSGSWGSTASAATYKNLQYFGSTATGILNVTGSSCTSGTWLGITSTDWNVSTNWCGGIPTTTTDVIIPAGPANQPVIGVAGGISHNLTINSGASLTITGSNTLSVSGNWSNNGTFTANTSTVNFNGTTQSISGTVSTTFYNLILSNSGTKTLGIAITVNSNLSITTGVIANLSTFISSAGTLTLGGTGQPSGSHGGTTSGATYINP
ncbi:MAG: hypothetical protein ABJB16_08370, partial [Saprospiraceae bacterium]